MLFGPKPIGIRIVKKSLPSFCRLVGNHGSSVGNPKKKFQDQAINTTEKRLHPQIEEAILYQKKISFAVIFPPNI